MAYQLTSATSVEDLINKIATFAVAAGWTARRNDLVSTNRTLTLQKSGDNIHIYNTDTSTVRVNGSVGYDGGLAANAQPNQAASIAQANVGTGPFPNVFLFASNTPAEHVFVVVEVASGLFRHIAFGQVVKIGAYTGGTFFDATGYSAASTVANNMSANDHHRLCDNGSGYSNSCGASGGGVRCDFDGNVNYFAPFRRPTDFATPVASGGFWGSTQTGGDDDARNVDFYSRSINSVAGVTPLAPILLRVERGSGFWSDIGQVPNIRFLNMSRFNAADEFTIGSDTWKVFPWLRKGNVSNQQYSQELAFAYLKTA